MTTALTTARFDRPGPDEFASFYAGYIAKVPDGDVVTVMAEQVSEVMTLLRPVPEAKASTAYAAGKWTLKEVIGHLADTERVMAYRAVTVARGDQTPLPGFDENLWVPPGRFTDRPLPSLIDEWVAVRSASIALFANLPADAPTRRGTANGKPISVRALAYIIPGHASHHLAVVKERYL
jgi:hypothetical protein